MGRSGIVTKEFKGDENTSYHDIIALFKILPFRELEDAD